MQAADPLQAMRRSIGLILSGAEGARASAGSAVHWGVDIDERLEALTQTVELLAATHRDSERQTEQLFGQVALRIREVTDGIERLARIAGVHQKRLDGHEKRLDDLEQGPRA